MPASCASCGQPMPVAPPAAPEPPQDAFQALLTAEERQRGVRRLHELSRPRQAEVRVALKAAK